MKPETEKNFKKKQPYEQNLTWFSLKYMFVRDQYEYTQQSVHKSPTVDAQVYRFQRVIREGLRGD